jgi:Dolichyl-phosphate-mannose-protein mannosyltransferase
MSTRLERALLAAVIVLALAIRVFYLVGTPNILSAEHEGYSKINLMLQWDQSPLPYPDANFGPAHTLFLWLPYKLTGNAVFPARLLTLLCGMLLLLPAWRLVRRRFGPPEALTTTALLALAFPLTIASVVTLSEIPFVFFTLVAIDLLDELVSDPKTRWGRLAGAAAAATAAAAFRFEGWPLLGVYAAWLLAHRRWREAAVFSAAVGLFPLAHMAECIRVTGNPLSFLGVSAEVSAVHAGDVPLGARVWLYPKALMATLGIPGYVLAVVALIARPARRQVMLPVLAFLTIAALIEFKAVQATFDPTLLRYMALSVALMALLAGGPMAIVRHGRFPGPRWLIGGLAIGLLAGAMSHAHAVQELRLLAPDREAFAFVQKLRPEVGPNERILLGSEYHPLIVVEAGLAWEHFRRPTYNARGEVDPVELAALMENWGPTLVCFDRGEVAFGRALGLRDEPVQELFGRTYRRVFTHGRWSVFRLEVAP